MSAPEHQVLRAEFEQHTLDYPPTCICSPVVVEQKWADIEGSPFISALLVCHSSLLDPDCPLPVEYL